VKIFIRIRIPSTDPESEHRKADDPRFLLAREALPMGDHLDASKATASHLLTAKSMEWLCFQISSFQFPASSSPPSPAAGDLPTHQSGKTF
jgi:hypothetical protein